MNYPLIKQNKEGTLLHPTHSHYSDDYAQEMCSLYLSDEISKGDEGKMITHYRLHSREAHNVEMALAYDIQCPKCSKTLKQVGRTLNYNDLGLYTCKHCNEH